METILSITTIVLYFSGALIQFLRLSRRASLSAVYLWGVSIAAIVLHGYLLYRWIDLAAGQNLSMLNLLSFAVWLVILFVALMCLRRPIENLLIIIFPLAACSIVLVRLFPEYHLLNMAGHLKQLIHILSAASAFAVVAAAALQAILLAAQNYLLRHQYVGALMGRLPPLEVMERLLFQIIWVGFFLLTWVLVSSYFLFDHLFQPPLLQKTLLTLVSWGLFVVLLCGRYLWGWRGRKVVYYTLIGFLMLVVMYLGIY